MSSVVLSHGDLDGITSAAIALLAFPGSALYFTSPSQIHHDLYRIARDAPKTVSISDIAVNVSRLDDILAALDLFPKSTKIYWTDHHPLEESHRQSLSKRVDFFHETGPCAAELVYRRFEAHLPDHALQLALYGAIGDYCDNTEFAIRHFEDFDKRTLYFEAGILVQALQELDYRRESRDLVYQLMLGIAPSSMNDIVQLALKATRIEHAVFHFVQANVKKNGPVGYVLDVPVDGYRGKAAKYAAYCSDANIGICARTMDRTVDMSIRRRNTTIDLNQVVNAVLPGLKSAEGGGHPAAAGARVDRADFPQFVQRLADLVSGTHMTS